MPLIKHFTSRVSFHPENDIMCSTCNEGLNICLDFSETALLQRYTASCIVRLSTIFGNHACTLLTLSVHAQRGLLYLVFVSVCLSVCLSV